MPDRLAAWKRFRHELDSLEFELALKQVIKFWDRAPFNPYYLDYDPNTWPDPWTMIADNCYCDLAKALGMLYTLYLSDHKDALEMEIRIYINPDTKQTYNLVWINQGKYVLNLEYDEVVNKQYIDQRLKLKETISIKQLKLQTL